MLGHARTFHVLPCQPLFKVDLVIFLFLDTAEDLLIFFHFSFTYLNFFLLILLGI